MSITRLISSTKRPIIKYEIAKSNEKYGSTTPSQLRTGPVGPPLLLKKVACEFQKNGNARPEIVIQNHHLTILTSTTW